MAQRVVSLLTATSNSGSACLRALLGSTGLTVRAGSRCDKKLAALIGSTPGAEGRVTSFSGLDAYKPETLNPLFMGADAALIVTPLDMSRGFADDAKLTASMIDTAVDAGVKQIVYVGSWTIHASQRIPLLANRFAPVDKYLLEGLPSFVSTTALRGGYFNQNFLHSKDAIREGKLVLPHGFQVPLVDSRDIGRCAAAIFAEGEAGAEKHAGKAYEISGPEMLTTEQIAGILSEELGWSVTGTEVAPETMHGVLPPPLAELWDYLAAEGAQSVPLSDDVRTLTGDHTRFRQWVQEHKSSF